MQEEKDNGCCDFPDCPTHEVGEALKKIAERLSDLKVFENDIRYIRETVEKMDSRITSQINEAFQRIRELEGKTVTKLDLFAAVGATGTIVGVISFVIHTAGK